MSSKGENVIACDKDTCRVACIGKPRNRIPFPTLILSTFTVQNVIGYPASTNWDFSQKPCFKILVIPALPFIYAYTYLLSPVNFADTFSSTPEAHGAYQQRSL